MKKLVAFVALPLFAVGAEVAPAHFWNFDKLEWNSRQAVDLGSAKGKCELTGRIATGQGTFGSDALCADAESHGRIARFPMIYDAWTFDCSFRLVTPLGAAFRPLFRYETSAAEKDGVVAGFVDGCLVVRANGFSAASEPLKVVDGTRYALRLSVTAEGRLRAWLDGRLVLEKTGAPSLKSLGEGRSCDGYPYLRVGGTRGPETLDGVIDDVAFFDQALDAPPPVKTVANYAGIALPEYREVSAASGSEVLVLGADGKAQTGRFRVADVMDSRVFGQMNAADRKFVEASSSATLTVADGKLSLVVECPVPAGMTVEPHDDLWSGDHVFVQIRANASDSHYFGYCVNANGQRGANVFDGKVPGWQSRAKVTEETTAAGFRVSIEMPYSEVFAKPPESGDSFGLNISRFGRTCGGSSSWARVGGLYNDAKWALGTVVVGGAKAFFARRLAAARLRGEAAAKGDEAKQAVAAACQAVEKAIAAHADEPTGFASLNRMFGELDKTLLAIALEGRPLLVYTPENIWGNSPVPTLASRPLELIRIRTPRNFRSVRPFAVANFGKEVFLGNLKFFDRYDGFYRTGGRWQPPKRRLANRFALSRALEIRGRDRRPLFDPLVELPLGSTLEVSPGKTSPIFAELDTHGVAPGRYYLALKLVSAIPGFPDESIAVEVTVTDDDPDVLPSDRIGYTHLATSFGAGGVPVVRPAVNCIRRLVSRGHNVILLSRIDDMYPQLDAQGVWQPPSYRMMDAYIDAWLAGGLDPKKMKLEPFIGVEREQPSWRGLRDATGKRVPFGTPAHDAGLRAFVKFFADHVKSKYGVGRDRIIWYPVDEANGKVDDPTFKSSASRCLHAGRLIRAESAENHIMWNPLPNFLGTDELRKSLKSFAQIFDIIELYRPKLTPAISKLVRESGTPTVWNYHISSKDSAPDIYRKTTWRNMNEGFSEVVGFWHMDESATLDSSAVHPYGSCYVDWDRDELLFSRRQLAADMGAEEGRLVNYLRFKFKDNPAMLAKIDAYLKEGAESSTMAETDAAFEKLIGLLFFARSDGNCYTTLRNEAAD